MHTQAWVKHRWRVKIQEDVPEPAGIPLEIHGKLAMTDVALVMLVGLPGASSSPACANAYACLRTHEHASLVTLRPPSLLRCLRKVTHLSTWSDNSAICS